MQRNETDTSGRTPRLLIVDDLGINRELLARRFEARGYRVTEADGGARALQLIAEQPFDLVLLDVMMPDVDGRDVLRRIREERSASVLPVIMVTARSESADVVEALELGANDYITKPVDFAVAWARVEAQVGRKRAEDEARETEARLRSAQKMEALGQLAGGIAHDFNNLLLVIDGYTRMAAAASRDPEVVQQLDEVLQATATAEALIKKLSVFSRRALVEREVTRLSAALEDIAGMLRPLLGARHPLRLEVDPAARELCAHLDPCELSQAVINLAINARDAMPAGGAVRLRLSAAEGAAEIAVQDAGCGMDEATRLRAFEPFFTTKRPGEGTGLGLAMVYGFVQQSGGSVAVESAPGRGSTFRLRLPCVEGAPQALAAAAHGEAPRGDETVLLVEDDDRLLRLGRATLEALGYEVLCAGNGMEALELESEHAVDLVLTDVVMPTLGGFELAGILRESRPALPILFMSGYPTAGALKQVAVPEGAQFLPKPFKPAELARAVRSALGSTAAPGEFRDRH